MTPATVAADSGRGQARAAGLYCPSASITPAVTRTAAAPLRKRLRAVRSSRPNFGKNNVNNTPKANTNRVVVDDTAETRATGARSEANRKARPTPRLIS